jgi:CRP-like cAMP-binding protein/anti-anti-sigma regulatory factor
MLMADREIWPVLLTLVIGAFGLAIVSSLDVLLCVRVMDAVIGRRSSGSRELTRLGAGNMIAACFGGIPSGVNLGASVTNYRAGGRTRLAIAVAASVTLLTMLFLAPVIALLPRGDRGHARRGGRPALRSMEPPPSRPDVRGGRAEWRVMGVDLVVVVLVAASILIFDPVVGVGVGVALAVLFFLVRMSKSVVRRAYHGDTVRSRRARAPELMERLAEQGRRIIVFELEGPIFFGTAEGLAGRVDAAAKAGARQVILDLKRVNELDSTGARILLQINESLRVQGVNLLLSYPPDNALVSSVLRDLGVAGALGEGGLFPDTDSALESAEDRVLLAEGGEEALGAEVVVERLSVLEGLSQTECAVVRALLVRRAFHAVETVIREGSEDRDLFLISRGTASVRVNGAGLGRPRRLASFSAGTVFGEVALLDQQPRSATVIADEDVVCYVLSEEAFHRLGTEHPAIAIRLLTNLGRELSRRIRRANAMMSGLEG